MCGALAHVRFVPMDMLLLLDHLVCTGLQCWRHAEAERLGGLRFMYSLTFVLAGPVVRLAFRL